MESPGHTIVRCRQSDVVTITLINDAVSEMLSPSHYCTMQSVRCCHHRTTVQCSQSDVVTITLLFEAVSQMLSPLHYSMMQSVRCCHHHTTLWRSQSDVVTITLLYDAVSKMLSPLHCSTMWSGIAPYSGATLMMCDRLQFTYSRAMVKMCDHSVCSATVTA